MDKAYELAKEIREKSGIQVDADMIESTAKYKTSSRKPRQRKDDRRRHRSDRRDPGEDKLHGGGDVDQGRYSRAAKDNDLDYIDDPVAKIYAPKALIRELEKLNEWNKDLQKQALLDERNIRKLNDKLAGLKEQLDDESEGTMKLVADREDLKLQIEDYKRKFFAVLLLSGLSEKDVTHFFQKNPRANEITDEMINIKQEIKTYMDQDKQNKYELMNPEILSKRVKLLEHWNEELNAANHDRVNALKNEIHLMKQDHHKAVDDLSNRVQHMSKRLGENNEVLHLVLTENLKLKECKAEIEAVFNKERQHLLEFLKVGDINPTNLFEGPGKLIEKSEKDTLTIKKLQTLISRTQNDLIRRENEIESYRTEFLRMERKVARALTEKEEYKKICEKTVQKLNERNEVLVKRAEKVDQRRKLEASGFRNEVKELTRFLNDLQKRLNYCLTVRCEKKMTEDFRSNEFLYNTLRAMSVGESSKKNMNTDGKLTEADNGFNGRENVHRLSKSKSTQIGSSVKPPKIKPTVLKSPSQSKTKQESGSIIKLKLCKLSTSKGSKSNPKNKPQWVDITAKDYSGKSKEPTTAALKQKDVKKTRDNCTDSKPKPKMKSVSLQCEPLDIRCNFDSLRWKDEDISTLLAQLNVPCSTAKKSPKGSAKHRTAENDENNNSVEEIQKQLKHATKRLDEIKRSTKILKHYDSDENLTPSQ